MRLMRLINALHFVHSNQKQPRNSKSAASFLNQILPLLLINQEAAEQRDGLGGNATPQMVEVEVPVMAWFNP